MITPSLGSVRFDPENWKELPSCCEPDGHKWFRGLESNQLPSAYETDERPVLFPGNKTIRQPDLHWPLPVTDGVRRSLRFGGI